MTKERKVIRQDWLESERGWGCRPDGYTLHLSESDRVAFVKAYWARMPDAVPDEYSRPYGEPEAVEVKKKIYKELEKQRVKKKPFGVSKYGLWY